MFPGYSGQPVAVGGDIVRMFADFRVYWVWALGFRICGFKVLGERLKHLNVCMCFAHICDVSHASRIEMCRDCIWLGG